LETVWHEPTLVQCTDAAGESHRLWAIDDPARCAAITEALGVVPLYVADGHHRYETALSYDQERRAEAPGASAPEAGRVLMVLVAADDPGLLVLPTHRVVSNVPDRRIAGLREALAPFFMVEDLAENDEVGALMERLATVGADGHALIVTGPGRAVCLLRPREDAPLPRQADAGQAALHDLDVWLAHTLVLERGLGLDAESASREEHLRYTRDAGEALAAVRGGSAQLALLLNATPPAAIMRVADAGVTMPQKSTYFYPKLLTGLIMRLLH
jgi:uncharacterized protein (DUF1015 family)